MQTVGMQVLLFQKNDELRAIYVCASFVGAHFLLVFTMLTSTLRTFQIWSFCWQAPWPAEFHFQFEGPYKSEEDTPAKRKKSNLLQ
jgi:hypothetical protein